MNDFNIFLNDFVSISKRPSSKAGQLEKAKYYMYSSIPIILKLSAGVVASYKAIELEDDRTANRCLEFLSTNIPPRYNSLLPVVQAGLRGVPQQVYLSALSGI